MLLTIAAFVFVLGVLIFVHELGHFVAAKSVGIAVPRFSIGFGPSTPLKFRRGETEYRVSWFPLGGYVKMASKEEQEAMGGIEGGELEEEYPPERLFENKPLFARIVVISAGVVMNAVFAWLVYSGLAATIGRVEDPTTRVASVDAEQLPVAARALADLPFGAQIVRINGDSMASRDDIADAVLDLTSERLRFDFAGDVDPIVLDIPGTDARARVGVFQALVPLWEPVISLVAPGRPAAEAGLEPGDRVIRIDGDTVRSWQDLTRSVEPRAGDTLLMAVLRADRVLETAVVPREETVQDPASGESKQVGQIGIQVRRFEPIRVRFGILEAGVEGARRTWDDTRKVLFTVKSMLFGRISPRELGGPIFIGQVSGQFAAQGILPLLVFMAFLSVNLAILNLLPIPVLDGGHLVFLLIEGIRGRPLSLDVRLRLTQLGMIVLLGIMVFALTNDVFRVFGG